MPITLIIPGTNHIINGQKVSVAELWATGLPIFQIFSGIALPLCAWLMLKRKSHSRTIYVFALSVGLVVYYVVIGELGGVVSGVIVTSLITAYLFMRNSVKEYFALGEVTAK
jgi:hypothetical protein